ncbi:2TM domain-containing protein [Lewinella sp. W8]|uniref:2TM domain-containing protein n=1 Tax=Lewinella sp. W8 TaxID=2528208 RepID=UPI0010680D20|nr:2TM domain-containing protein [Lewinella sp. W8]MTB51105.1 hypothetical protein [Lewinella sp. W8]
MEDQDIYAVARKKVKAKKGFFYHLITYAFIVGLLYVIMQFANRGDIFPVIIVAISWGIGIVIHYFQVFGTEHLGFLGISPDWEEDALENEIDKLERKRELKNYLQKETELLEDVDNMELKELDKRPLKK